LRKLAVVILFILSIGQDQELLALNYIDSLIQLSENSPNNISKANVLLDLTENCPIEDIDIYAIQLIDLTTILISEENSSTENYTLKSYKAQAYNNLGFMHKKQGQVTEALENFYHCLNLSEAINDSSGMADVYSNLGSTLEQQEDYEASEKYFQKALKLYLALNDKEGIGIIYNNMGQLFETKGDFKKSVEYYRKGEKLWDEIDMLRYKGYALNNIGVNYDKLGYSDSAMKNYQEALLIFESENSPEDLAWTYNLIGRNYLEAKKIAQAEEFFTSGYKIANSLNAIGTKQILSENLYYLYNGKRDFPKALHFYKLNISLKDSIKNESTQKAAAKQLAKYEYEKQKVLDDAAHEKQLAIEQEEKEKQQILTYATAAGLGLVGLFLLVVFNRLKVTRRQKNIIEDQKLEVEQQKSVVEEAHAELEEKNKEITDSIQYAKRIQSAILPPDKLIKEYLQESFVLYKPKDIVAGDFYWLESVGNKVLFAAADCTGHGVPGAMVSVVCNNGLNRSVREHGLTDPGEILGKTREIVVQEFEKSEEEVKDGMDIALCCLEGNRLEYAGAHNPLWIIRNGELLETKANKQPIGKFDNPEPYTTHKIDLQIGDSIYIFSDGFADQFGGEKGKKLKTANFKKLLLSLQQESMEHQRHSIDKAFEDWKGNLEQLDDVCVIGIKI
jgi:serine phosphatase RsbU (regulator of sigma subunit)/Tfp pilus assembly protein PilF